MTSDSGSRPLSGATLPAIPSRSTGSHLYKYSQLQYPERLRDIILCHTIYVPSLKELDDPADGRPRLADLPENDITDFLLKSYIRDHPKLGQTERSYHSQVIRYNVQHYGSDFVMRAIATAFNAELAGYRLYSMSKRYDNMHLWAKYAGEHSGYCLEFANTGPFFEHAKDVVYEEAVHMDVNDPNHKNGYWLFCKKPEWSNQEEIRVVVARNLSPHVSIRPEWLTRIILGCKITEKHERMIRDWSRERQPKLPVVRATYDEYTQKITLRA